MPLRPCPCQYHKLKYTAFSCATHAPPEFDTFKNNYLHPQVLQVQLDNNNNNNNNKYISNNNNNNNNNNNYESYY